jgi:hypothetical protein
MEMVFWLLGGAFVGYVLWVLMTSDGRRGKGRGKKGGDGGGWFGGGWDGDGGSGGGGGD